MELKLYEAMQFIGKFGFDIGDNYWDYGNYFETPKDEDVEDSYNKVMNYFAHNIICLGYKEDWYSCCKITEFIMEHKKAFDNFIKNHYKEEFIPQSFNIKSDNEEFYDLYIELFNSLLNGAWSYNSYEDLYNELTKKEK